MNRPSLLPCVLSFLAGFVAPAPLWLVLAGQPVAGIQLSLFYMSAVAIAAASAPWWTDAIENRRTARLLREHGIDVEG